MSKRNLPTNIRWMGKLIWCFFFFANRVPVVSDCSGSSGQNGPVRVAAGSSSNTLSAAAPTRVPSPSPNDSQTPVAENWCYTQVSEI